MSARKATHVLRSSRQTPPVNQVSPDAVPAARRITNSGLNVHMEERDTGAVSLQQVRTVRRCQRKVGALMDELNQVAKQIATVWMSFPPGSSTDTPLGEAVKTLDLMMLQGDQVAGWLDDWILALQAKEQAQHDHAQ